MTRLLSFNPEPFEAESEMNGALLTQRFTRGTSGQQSRFRQAASSARSPYFGAASAASGAERWPQPEWEIGPTAVARPRTRRRPTRPASPPPPSPAAFDAEAFRKKAVEIAKQELARWGNGKIKETDPRLCNTLQDYWKTGTGASFSQEQLGNPAFQNANPWSAAFISWLMKTAGAGSAFKYGGYHAAYTRAAIDNRLANNSNPFKAYRISEVAPRAGDLVCKSRAGSGATYDNVRPPMKTHCDIVTEVRPRSIVTVGGNVSDSVAQKILPTDPDGRIVEPDYFAVIQIDGQQPSSPVGPLPTPAQPAAVTAPRLLRQEANPPGTTLYVEIDLKIVDKFGITAPPVTGIFIPDGYRPGAAVDLILYLHGFKAEAIKRQAIDQYWNSQRFPYGALREGANASGRNVILVAPTLGSHSEAKRLLATGGLDGYLSQVLSALAAYGPFRPAAATPALGSLILACHSGGGWPMRQLAGGSDRALALLRECWGFDCTYNQGDDDFWAGWARTHSNARVYIYYIAGSPTARYAESLRNKHVPNAIAEPSRDKRHNYVPVTYWTERIQGAPFLAARSGGAVQPPPTPAAPVDVRRLTRKQFIAFVGENARRAMAATGVPASVSVAQAILETGWGKHTIGEAKNLFGIKGRGPAGSVRAPTREYIGGKWVTVDADFAKYDSFEQSITDHARFFLRNRRYAGALQFKNNPEAFAREIHKAGYATAPDYAEQLIALMRQYNLHRFDQ